MRGFSGEVIHLAKLVRRPLLFASAAGGGISGAGARRIRGNEGSTLFSGFVSAWGLPR